MAHRRTLLNGLDLSERTPAEELWLWRKARRLTSREAAEALGIGRTHLWALERDPSTDHTPLRRVQRPTLPLLLLLARRRSGLGLRGTARVAGVSHTTVLNWEARGEAALISWWERRGYRFPV